MIWKKVKEDKPLKYFPLEEIIKEPGLINIAITARGYGKTYAFVKKIILQYIIVSKGFMTKK